MTALRCEWEAVRAPDLCPRARKERLETLAALLISRAFSRIALVLRIDYPP